MMQIFAALLLKPVNVDSKGNMRAWGVMTDSQDKQVA